MVAIQQPQRSFTDRNLKNVIRKACHGASRAALLASNTLVFSLSAAFRALCTCIRTSCWMQYSRPRFCNEGTTFSPRLSMSTRAKVFLRGSGIPFQKNVELCVASFYLEKRSRSESPILGILSGSSNINESPSTWSCSRPSLPTVIVVPPILLQNCIQIKPFFSARPKIPKTQLQRLRCYRLSVTPT